MSDEKRVRVKYVGGDERITRATVNGKRYDFDPADKAGFLIPAGDAGALVTGEPTAWEYVSEKLQEAAEVLAAESTDSAAQVDGGPTGQGGRAYQENAGRKR